jgi:hypothetical protein
MIHRGPSTFRVTDPPDSRSTSRPVSNCLAAFSRRRYGNGFLGANGNPVDAGGPAVTSGPVIVAVMSASMVRLSWRRHE